MSRKGEYNAIIEMDADSSPSFTATIENDDGLQFQNFATNAGTSGKMTAGSGSANFSSSPNFFNPHQNIQDQALGSRPIWTVEYYSKFFDVDTEQVLERCFKSLYPRDNFLEVLQDNPDLYGPFWISTTVVFSLFVTSSLAGSLAAFLAGKTVTYDFTMLSFAVVLVYTYGLGLPILFWVALKYYGCQPSLLECVDLYGYSMTIWIPISVLCVIPIDILRWVLVAAGFAVSAIFLTKNLYAIISRTDAKTARILLIAIWAAHGIFALILKLYFFNYDFRDAATGNDST
ncbi:hypothetical protein BZG36_02080 [Bifiguratus adelaidae]|uniref:Protein YIP n=1 Tax=Bifiguratus adelaidae TaxID=1938954 RepID=A0A261Y375_9FUNG|nr:hypothetical protein BZG36_02080 [Bifiguratus adelaidae]